MCHGHSQCFREQSHTDVHRRHNQQRGHLACFIRHSAVYGYSGLVGVGVSTVQPDEREDGLWCSNLVCLGEEQRDGDPSDVRFPPEQKSATQSHFRANLVAEGCCLIFALRGCLRLPRLRRQRSLCDRPGCVRQGRVYCLREPWGPPLRPALLIFNPEIYRYKKALVFTRAYLIN